jgi:hypothetical protein
MRDDRIPFSRKQSVEAGVSPALQEKEVADTSDQRCTGMEFATEMIIKASLRGEKIAEVPITLYPDKRTSHAPHLKTFRDGWRTFRYFLMCSPRWLFLVPGGVFIAFGLLGYLVAMPGLRIGHSTFDAHTLLFASLSILCGYQCILFAIFAKTFATTEGFLPPDRHLERFFEVSQFGKRTGRRGVGGAGWWQLVAGRSLAMVAHWLWPLGLCPHDAIRCAGSNACRIGVSNGLLQLFRQPSWDASKMSLIA